MYLNPWHIKLAARYVRAGGVIAYPTEAVYGLGCAPLFPGAVRRVLELKRRPPAKGLILVAAEFDQLRELIDLEQVPEPDRILATWPGPVTWILPARPGVPGWLRGRSPGLAVRVSDHPIVRELCLRTGPLVSTSANPASAKPARSRERALAYFGPGLDYILPGPLGGRREPTEIRDGLSGRRLRSSA